MSFPDPSPTRQNPIQNEVFTYKPPWPLYALSFTNTQGSFLISSMLEQSTNYIQHLSFNNTTNTIQLQSTANHLYPPTKIMWSPPTIQDQLFATSSDCLRLWRFEEGQMIVRAQLAPHYDNKEYNGPLTSFDWCVRDPGTLGTASIDKTCTIWDLNKQMIKKQILAHNNEVNDIAFSHDSNIFVTASTDCSVRKFDLRSLDQCSIIYENPRQTAVVRVCWNKCDPNYLAVLNMDSSSVIIIDIRNQMCPVNEIKGYSGGINSMCWAPNGYCICIAGEDCHVLIKDTGKPSQGQKDNVLIYNALAKVLGVTWSNFDEIAMVLSESLQYIKL